MNNKFTQLYNEWLNSDLLSQDEKNELLSIKNDPKEIEDRFYKELEFGTGGLRGIMQIGTNRMNRFIIAKATQGFANYLNKNFKNPKVAIGFDSRNNSSSFANIAANVLASNGIKVFLFKELMPTPAVSFAIRYLRCDAGIVITASHNPKMYNGYKVYCNDGSQCREDVAGQIYNEILSLDTFKDPKIGDFNSLINEGKIEYISEEVFEAYMSSTKKQSIYNEDRILNIAYSPLHGAGRKCITTILDRDGFKHVDVVKEQEEPNGDFPTCPYPNPEINDALKLGIDLMLKNDNDILIASDPDSDRIGVVVNQNGKPIILTGNEVGIILFDAIYRAKLEQNCLTKNPVVVKTIVSSDMVNVIAKDYGVLIKEVLTGFKYIGEQVALLEENNDLNSFMLGFEESCGYLTNVDVRDKDAVNASLLVAEVSNHYKLLGKTLADRLNELYKKYGDFKSETLTFEFPGIEGMDCIKSLMNKFREKTTKDAFKIVDYIGDYDKGIIAYNNHIEPTHLPKSNVVKFFLKNGETVTLRPSGTEPKLKAYIFANGYDRLNELKAIVQHLINEKAIL